MEFNEDSYSRIKTACMNRQEIEFLAPIAITAFEKSAAPEEWTAYPPCLLPPEGYAYVLANAGNDARGSLMKLELLIYLDHGRVFYKAAANQQVAIKVSWPKA